MRLLLFYLIIITSLQQLYLNGNNLQTEGTIKIARGLENTSTLIVFSISNN